MALEETTDGIDIPADEQQALEACLVLLRSCRDPRVAALHDKCDALANPSAEVRALRKFSREVAELRKADSALSRSDAMERVRKSDPALQRELYDAQHAAA